MIFYKSKSLFLEDTFFKDGYSYNKKTKNRVSAILIVHVWGNANDFTEILSLCRERNIRILEDASESLGSFTNDAHTGLIGDLGVFSFNGNKIITTGGGGCILSNNSSLLEKVEYLSQQSKDDPINFIHNEIGFNYRMSNISAAIGYGQILHIDEILIKKKLLRDKYDYIVSKTKDLILRPIPERGTHNCWLNLITFNKKVDLIKITHQLDEDGIQVRPVWQLCHLQSYLTEYPVPYPIVNAKKIRESSLCLPSSYDLELDLIELILQKVSKYAKINLSIVSTSRADIGIYSPLLIELNQNHRCFNTTLIYSGTNLFDGADDDLQSIKLLKYLKLKNLQIFSQNYKHKTTNYNFSNALKRFDVSFAENKIDLLVVLGDRFEMFAAAISAYNNLIPIAHIHGGEVLLDL